MARKIALYQDHLENLDLHISDLPSTTVKFDTRDSAPFTEHSDNRRPQFKEKHLEILWKWSHGHTYKSLGLHPMEINRILRKYVRDSLEHKVHSSQD